MTLTRSALLITALASVLSMGTWAPAQTTQPSAPGAASTPQSPPTPRGRAGRGSNAPYDLHTAMESMDRVYRAIKADAPDAARQEQALRSIATLQRDIAISKMFLPKPVEALTGDARAKAVTSYRAMMVGLMKAAIDLETAVTEKKPDAVKTSLAQIDEIMKAGHAEFAPGH